MNRRLGYCVFLMIVFCSIALVSIGYADGNVPSIQPRYSYTQDVAASLSINSNGSAHCSGSIAVYDMSSEINLNVRLQQKVGETWILVKKWSDTVSGERELYIEGDYTVSAGVYRVIASGIVTDVSGRFETVSCTTSQRTYP